MLKRIEIYIYKNSLLSDIVKVCVFCLKIYYPDLVSHFLNLLQMKLSIFLMLSLAALSWAEGDKKKDELGTVIGIDLGTTYSW